jgi:hypothetical protein
MKIIYHLNPVLFYYQKNPHDSHVQRGDTYLPGAEEFVEKYKSYGEQESYISYIFESEEILSEAIATLEKSGLSGKYYYRIRLEPNEIETYPAFYLVIPSQIQPIIYDDETGEQIENIIFFFDEEIGAEIVDLEALEGCEIMEDFYDYPHDKERIVVSPRIKEILETVTQGVNWRPTGTTTTYEWIPISREDIGKYDNWMENTETGEVYTQIEKAPQTWFIMEVQEKIPDPIFVPFPREVRFNSGRQTYLVFNDGRSVITQASINKLAECGIAITDEVQTPEGIYKDYRSLVASGRVIQALFDANITLFDKSFATPLWEYDRAINATLQENSNA